jgi:capsular polysaccharide export protein
MIRSTGLGAHCVPPLSVIIDPLAAHFDPSQPSTLENILQHGEIAPELVTRAQHLRHRLVAAGISKYGQDAPQIVGPPAAPGQCRRILVTGQVEDDRAVLLGGAGCTNRDLLARARSVEPDAELIYKPHPDVEAGHRRGAIPDAEVLLAADRIERHAAISTLLEEVDGLHVISSLAGFEALCRGVAVTTHGVPFYAGWGLTHDLGPVPARRQRARSLDELIAAVLILYPRYLDPVTRLPCPVEVLVERMAAGEATVSSPLVALREWQGKASLWLERVKP